MLNLIVVRGKRPTSLPVLSNLVSRLNECRTVSFEYFYEIGIWSLHNKKKSGVALTQLSLTLHCSRRIFY